MSAKRCPVCGWDGGKPIEGESDDPTIVSHAHGGTYEECPGPELVALRVFRDTVRDVHGYAMTQKARAFEMERVGATMIYEEFQQRLGRALLAST